MSFLNLKRAVLALPEGERIAYLQTQGYKRREDAEDVLRFLLSINQEAPDARAAKPDRFQEVLARAAAMAEEARRNPPAPKVDGMTPFERDVLHNRHILGGSTVHDAASFHNPNLRKTQTTTWLLNEFMPSGRHFALILGQPGCGKTFGSIAYVNRIAQVEVNVGKIQRTNARYVHAYRIAEMLGNTRKHSDELEDLTRCGVLLLDDLGTEPVGWRGKDFESHFGYLIGERHRFRRRTLITSNLTIESKTVGTVHHPGFREVYGETIVSRFSEIGLFMETKENDLRRIEQ